MTLDLYRDDHGSADGTAWDLELIVDCFDRALGEPFEREKLERDDVWVKYKVCSHDEVINSNLILDYGNEDDAGNWVETSRSSARYLAFSFACQLWLDYPTPMEIQAHVQKGLVHMAKRMETGENGILEDSVADGRRKIYFEREGLFDLRANPMIVQKEALAWADMAMGDISVAARHIIYPDYD